MINTRIYKVLTSLDKPMLNRFSKFIHSPYHNVNEKISGLVDLLIDAIKSEAELQSKKDIWKRIKIKGEYEDLKFRKLCNDCLDNFENFLVYEEINQKKLLKANLLLESIKNKKLEELVDKNVTRINRLFQREIIQSSEYYYNRYVFEKSIQSLKTNYEKKANIKQYLNEYNFTEFSDYLHTFFAIEKLRFAADTIALNELYNSKIKIDLSNTLELIEEQNLEQYPAVKVYLYMFNVLTSKNDYKSFKILKSFAFQNIDHFPTTEQREIIDALNGFCIKQINLGNTSFLTELLDLYDWGIKTSIVLINNVLSPTTFRNYIVSGLRAGEFDKVERFIIEKSQLLEETRRDNAVNFNLARVFFYKKEFNKVLEYLNQVNYDDVWYNLNSKILLLMAYYELGEDMVLESLMESFQAFLRRQSEVQDMKIKMYSNFVIYLKRIYKSNLKGKSYLEKTKTSILAEKTIGNKSWLLEKIDELL